MTVIKMDWGANSATAFILICTEQYSQKVFEGHRVSPPPPTVASEGEIRINDYRYKYEIKNPSIFASIIHSSAGLFSYHERATF